MGLTKSIVQHLTKNLSVSSLAMVMVVYCHSSPVPMKTEYVIGGWYAGDWQLLYTKWKPIFETHLTETVGRLYNPPISFKLVAVDQNEETLTEKMVKGGKIDFLCELLRLFLC